LPREIGEEKPDAEKTCVDSAVASVPAAHRNSYAVFFAGSFLRDSARKQNLNYTSFWVGYKL
jgi:hypothetical protein